MYTYDFPPPSVACLKNNAWNNFLLLLFLLQTVFLCNPGWPWTQVLPVFKTCILSPSSTSTSSAKKHIPHKLLLLTDSSHQEAQAFTICVPRSLLSEGQRWSTQQSQTTSEERLSTWNPQLLDKEGCSQCLPMQRGGDKVPGQMESATKHKQCHACLPSVVTVLKPSAFNKSDKKCDIDEQQLFVYFKTTMGRSLNVFNTNDKYLRC